MILFCWNFYGTRPSTEYRWSLKKKAMCQFVRSSSPWNTWKIANVWFLLNNFKFKFKLMDSLKLIWYMTGNKIQIELEKGGYVCIWTRVIALERSEKWKTWFLLNNWGFNEIYMVLDNQQNTGWVWKWRLCINLGRSYGTWLTRIWTSLKFIWHMTSNKTGFKKGNDLSFGQKYLSWVHDMVALFMFTLIADWTRVGSKLCYR